MERLSFVPSPIGLLGLAEESGRLTRLFFARERIGREDSADESPLLRRVAAQLDEYFKGERSSFDLPLAPRGTDFQRAVWDALLAIPYGETTSYKAVAERVGNPAACRAVGMANNRNPIAVIIPCHRVVGSNGSLTGYAAGLPAKQLLLDLERRYRPG